MNDWKEKMPGITAGYFHSDICNVDETGLFYRALLDKSPPFVEKSVKKLIPSSPNTHQSITTCSSSNIHVFIYIYLLSRLISGFVLLSEGIL